MSGTLRFHGTKGTAVRTDQAFDKGDTLVLYLSFLEYAVAEFDDSIRGLEQLREAPPAERTPLRVARTVVALHLALEKAVKHAVARIDPSLLVKTLSARELQRLHAERIRQDVPRIVAVSGKLETFHLNELLEIATAFVVPPLGESSYQGFCTRARDLVYLRNQAVHQELAVDADAAINTITQVLSRVRQTMELLAPDFLEAAYRKNDQLRSRLIGIEREVDGSWQVLVDYLRDEGHLVVPAEVWITIPPGVEYVEVGISGKSVVSSGILASARVLHRPEDGFLTRPLPLPPPPAPLLAGGLLAVAVGQLLASSERTNSAPLEAAFRPPPVREPDVVVPTEAGSVGFRDVPARISLTLPGRIRSFLSVSAVCDEVDIAFEEGVRGGSIEGRLRSAAPRAGDAPSISITGEVLLNSEFAVREGSEGLPAGTTLRHLSGEITFGV